MTLEWTCDYCNFSEIAYSMRLPSTWVENKYGDYCSKECSEDALYEVEGVVPDVDEEWIIEFNTRG